MEIATMGALAGAGASLIGGYWNKRAIEQANNANLQLQRDFATSGIRMRVEDAKQAGIHPLYALGAPTMSPAVSVMPETGIGDAMAQLGQNISRASKAGMDADELNTTYLKERVYGAHLDNMMKEISISKQFEGPGQVKPIGGPTGIAGSIIEGQGDSAVQVKPFQREPSSLDNPGRTIGTFPMIQYGMGSDGGLSIMPSKDAKERMEDQFGPEMMFMWKEMILPALGPSHKPSQTEFPLPLGYDWKWNKWKQAYYPEKMENAGKSYSSHGNMPSSGEYRRY